MDPREEMAELERLHREARYSTEEHWFRRRSKWGERIHEEIIWGIEQRRPDAIEDGILYLEVSPWYFRSGYHKAIVAHKLKAVSLTPGQKERLRQVILDAAIGVCRVGPEFSWYAKLAPYVANESFLTTVAMLYSSTKKARVQKRLERVQLQCQRVNISSTPPHEPEP